MKFWLTCLFVLCLGAGTVRATPATQPDRAAESRQVIAEPLDRIVPEVKFDGVGFADVLDFLSDVSKANLFIDWRHVEQAGIDRNAPIKLSLNNRKFADILQAILEAAGGKGKILYHDRGDEIIISTKEGEAIFADGLKADAAQWDEKTKLLMRRSMPEVSFDGSRLEDCIKFLQDATGGKIDVAWDRFEKEAADAPATIKLRNVPLGDAVRLIFLSATDKPIEITGTDHGLHIAPTIKPVKAANDKPGK